MRNSHNHPYRSTIKTSDITLKIAAMAHMQMAELWAFWDSYFASRPIHPNRKHLESRLAYRLQELTFGGVPFATKILLAGLGERFSKIKTSTHQSIAPLPGTILLREFDGHQYCVKVLADGRFEINGQIYKSLSAIARMITGTSGTDAEFFELTGKQ